MLDLIWYQPGSAGLVKQLVVTETNSSPFARFVDEPMASSFS